MVDQSGNKMTARFRGIDDVIRELGYVLRSGNGLLENDFQLLEVIEKLGIKIDSGKTVDVADVIEKLNHLKLTTDEEVLNARVAEAMAIPEEDLENARVPIAKISELVEEYERHLKEGLDHEEAVKRVAENNKGLVAKKNVATFLERQKEIYQETLQSIKSEAGQGRSDNERLAKMASTQQLFAEERLKAVGIDGPVAKEIAKETVGSVATREMSPEETSRIAVAAVKKINNETIRQYAQEVAQQGVEIVKPEVKIAKQVEDTTKWLIENLKQISPDEVSRSKAQLERVITEKIVEQIAGKSRPEEKSVGDRETGERQQQEPKKLSEQIMEALDLPPSKTAIVEKAVGEASVEATGWNDDKTTEAVEILVEELTKTPGIMAEAKGRENEIRKAATEEIRRAVSQGNGFEGVVDRVSKIVDPDLGKRVAIELAVERIEARGREWSDLKIEKVTDELVAIIGPEAVSKKADIRAAVSEQARLLINENTNFLELSQKVTGILKVPDSEAGVVIEAVVAAEAKGKAWDMAKTDQATNKLMSVLKTDGAVSAKLTSSEPGLQATVRAKVEAAVADGLPLQESTRQPLSPKNLTERIAEILDLPKEKRSQVNLAVRNAELTVDRAIMSDKGGLELVRAQRVRNEIERGFDSVNKKLEPEQVVKVHNYAKFVGDFYSEADLDVYKNEAVAFAEGRGNKPGIIKNAWGDLNGISKIVRMPPKQFKIFQEKYFQLKNEVKGLKTPFNVPELRSLDGLMKLTQEIPQIRNLLTFAQKFTEAYSSINNLTGGFLTRIGLEKAGTAILERIGGQAVGEFVRQSLVVIAENGIRQGLTMILNGILGGGVQAGAAGAMAAGGAAAGAGASGALAGAVAAFQAIPVVGQIILVVAAAIVLAVKVVKPIVDKVKKFAKGFTDALGIDLSAFQIGTKKFLQDNFGKLAGGLMDFGLKIGMAVLAIPTLLMGIKVATSPIAWVFIGLMGMGLMTSLNVSAMVPRGPPAGVEVYEYDEEAEPFVPGPPLPTRDPSIVIPESCPGIWPTSSGVVSQGPLGHYSHRTAQAIDISVGSVPIMATHDGLALPGGSLGSDYGYYVDVVGTCNGKAITTRYAHMPSLVFTSQKLVQQGEIIGYVDNTGNSTGSHLHYELFGGQINDWLPKPVPLRCSEAYECNISIP